jgi:four helix bundle protein
LLLVPIEKNKPSVSNKTTRPTDNQSMKADTLFHERTTIYQRSLELMKTAAELISQLPTGFGFLADQLRRNTSSVAHNFAEGYYQRSAAQQRRFMEYAGNSAREARTSFDTAACFGVGRAETIRRGRGVAGELVRMLAKFRRGGAGSRQ